MLSMSSWGHFAGRDDVQPALHIPMVYESITASPQHWEYRVLSIDTREEALPDEARLSELGTQGWLLVSVWSRVSLRHTGACITTSCARKMRKEAAQRDALLLRSLSQCCFMRM